MQNHALYWITNLLVLICVPIFVLRYWAKEASRLGRRRIKLTSPSRFAPARAARERRELVRTFLSTERNRFQSFIETPPDIEAQAENLDSLVPTEVEQSWQLSRLELQLASDRTLLAERVTDALVSYHRVGRIKSEDFPLSIQLEPRKSQRGLYPWSAVIVVERAESIIRCLTPITEWLGIGVEVLETRQRSRAEGGERRADGDSVSTIPQGRCSVGYDGLEGTVGGLIMTESEPGLGVTCRHVLSDHCGSLRHGLNPHPAPHQGGEFTQQVPDVAFIHLGSGCFGSGDEPSCEVIPTTQAKIYDLADQEEVVHKQPEADKTLGLILCAEMSGFKLGRFFYRGPHFSIKPYHLRRFGIIWRLDRSFSQRGDSGSWIVSRGGLWLGMVVGAYESPSNITVALSSEHIVNAFRKMNGLGSTSNERCSAFY